MSQSDRGRSQSEGGQEAERDLMQTGRVHSGPRELKQLKSGVPMHSHIFLRALDGVHWAPRPKEKASEDRPLANCEPFGSVLCQDSSSSSSSSRGLAGMEGAF